MRVLAGGVREALAKFPPTMWLLRESSQHGEDPSSARDGPHAATHRRTPLMVAAAEPAGRISATRVRRRPRVHAAARQKAATVIHPGRRHLRLT